jgi:DNA-binding protein H-NS
LNVTFFNVKTPEQEAAIRAIRKLIDFWQISLDELDGVPQPVRAAAPVLVPPKYRHPTSGEQWDGQGAQPDWLKHALTREGYTVDELRCPLREGAVGEDSDSPH